MNTQRGEFSSRIGFILAASGSAVGLGNIWGFPTQAASNGGGAFLVVYLILAFALAYPALMAELIIGRYAKANAVKALGMISPNTTARRVGMATGFAGLITASLILSFYAIVAGWMVAFSLAPGFDLVGADSSWLTDFSTSRNLGFTGLFMLLTVLIISAGVEEGIEKWSARLMPTLIVILLLLIAYVLTLDGAMDGLKRYLIPDFSQALSLKLVVNALGQAFFSMSLGVGTMLIYGSYISKSENIASLGRAVTLLDVGVAVTAGLLILPAMHVALHNGVPIYNEAGGLLAEDTLIFAVLPALFETMGTAGAAVSFAFFVLMTIASLTSSISMLEAPVAYTVENHGVARKKATWLIGAAIMLVSILIILNFQTLFGLTITVTTRYGQPLLGLMFCIFAGWVWHRNQVLAEVREGAPHMEHSFFWKVWPHYVRYVCPVVIAVVFLQKILS